MHIAAIQMVSTPDVATNLATAARLLQQAADQGAELAALPEYFCLMGHSDRDKLAHAEAPGHGPLQTPAERPQSSIALHLRPICRIFSNVRGSA